MNPKHLTYNVRKQAANAVNGLNLIKKAENSNFKKNGRAFENEDDFKQYFNSFYEPIKEEVDNSSNAFLELCSLEDQYGFCSSYIGGATFNPNGNTLVKICKCKGGAKGRTVDENYHQICDECGKNAKR